MKRNAISTQACLTIEEAHPNNGPLTTLNRIDFSKYSSGKNSPILAIMGPTASGKSSLAMQISDHIPVEIISADSMQLYKGMNIGVAKPTIEEQKKVRHHLLDICDISKSIDVYQYVELAKQAIIKIRSRKKIPLIVGGSGMYIRALFYGLDPLPADKNLRTELDKKYDNENGFIELQKLMSKVNPEDFTRWEKHQRKLIRALEVFTLTGLSITALQKTWKGKLLFPVNAYKLHWERTELRERVAIRSMKMLEKGWIEETKKLIQNGLLQSPTAKQAIGYPIIAQYLNGDIDYDTMISKIITSTRQFARRQDTWFKNKHPEATIIEMS